MIVATVILLMAQATAAPPSAADDFAVLREIIAPSLSCERSFDVQRRKLLDEERVINEMPADNPDRYQLWAKADASFQEREQQFKKARAAKCKPELYADRLKAKLISLQPKLPSLEIHQFSVGFYNDLRSSAEAAADFSAGHVASRYTPPPTISPPK